ncbi:nucleotide sugar dehydrogenase [uncultured Selenomonas sp.]|uniref:nucleotide sugar dehydrogenase n=1 Tax=uncultured Selenomonas sp. TaxID=159275 RepID=UPI0028E3BAB9|nr:nucleotide sugar dehydrogenase [uncultured Selenomonas sp.]
MLERLERGAEKLAVVGLGYVGLPLAAAFSKRFSVIGYDRDTEKIAAYRAGIDPTGELSLQGGRQPVIDFTWDEERLREASFLIVAVPTPINGDKTPDLTPLKEATRTIARNLRRDSVVVYESTVYPGVTEDICTPLLEEISGLRAGVDFRIGYSPERINPGDRVNRLNNIVKIVSGMDEETLNDIADVYGTIIQRVHRTSSIRVAEAAKVAENTQRDINIAFMNELAMVFHRMDIDTNEVVAAMNTKWNALGFQPGLVGGHCIGVDPYYFIYQAQSLGYHSQLISTGRRINDGMSGYVAQMVVRELVRAKVDLAEARVYLMGMTFKENCPDIRNSRAAEVYQALSEYNLNLRAVDPHVKRDAFRKEYGFDLVSFGDVHDADCIVFLVAHDEFRNLTWKDRSRLFRADGARLIIDVKGMFSRAEAETEGCLYWSL